MLSGKVIETRIYETTRNYDALRCLCYEAKEYGFGAIQVFPCMIELTRETLKGADTVIDALIAYPHGGFTIEQKAAEAAEAVRRGAGMVEVLINTREIKSGNYDYIYREMDAVKKAVGKDIHVAFNIEIESLTDDEAIETCKMAVKAGIDGIATSTGLYHTLDANKQDVPLVASAREVAMLKKALGDTVAVKAVGNITTAAIAQELLSAGADMVSSEFAGNLMH